MFISSVRIPSLWVRWLVLPLAGVFISGAAVANHDGGADATPNPNSVSLTLEGCRQEKLPAGYNLEGNGFLCDGEPGVDGYTTGNLGKLWNELDLVPWRVTAAAGNSAPASQTYTIAIVVDRQDTGKPGYDVITAPVLNTSLSHSSCGLISSAELILSPGFGGTDISGYRFLTITQDKNTTCVIDGQARLAVGSHLYPGASLHMNLGNHVLTTSGIGNKDVSIPVNEILPQELRKDMSATQDTDFAWNLTKAPTPSQIEFGDTCDASNDLTESVAVRVEWEILPGTPGMVTVITNIYATNPAARSITVNVTDVIFAGTDPLDTATSGPIVVPKLTNMLVFTHTFDAPANVSELHDVATATYTDQVTGIPVPGQTIATASASIQPGTDTNTTATISDTESISGAGLTFSVDTKDGADGSFGAAYVLGTEVTGPVDWQSDSQAGDGFVQFNKSIYLDEPRITTGTLSDTATLIASDGFTTNAGASVNIQSDAEVKLTIHKSIPDILQGDETLTFTFDIDGPNAYENQVTIEFGAGETTDSVTISGLEPGLYMVDEINIPGGLVPTGGTQESTTIALPSCAGSVTFDNVIQVGNAARAEVRKVTFPGGSEAGWKMTLAGPGGPEVLLTGGTDYEQFALPLEEGDYTITETEQSSWDKTSETGCSFSVNYPADFDQVFQCTFINTQRGQVTIIKETNPDGGTGFGFVDNIASPNAFTLDDDGFEDFTSVVPGTYMVTEDDPTPGFDLVGISCVDSDTGGTDSAVSLINRRATINLDPGETVTCTFTNQERGMVEVFKTSSGVPTAGFTFEIREGASIDAAGDIVVSGTTDANGYTDFGGVKLMAGTYQFCETGMMPGWSNTIEGFTPDGAIPEGSDNSTECIEFVLEPGETETFTVNNIPPPEGDARTIGFWKNWTSCDGRGRQDAVLDDNLPVVLGTALYEVNTCEIGVDLLDKRKVADPAIVGDGQKSASDPIFNMVAQLVAAKLNLRAGAAGCQELSDVIAAADDLLDQVGFDGGESSGALIVRQGKKAMRRHLVNSYTTEQSSLANELAGDLDAYNNNTFCL